MKTRFVGPALLVSMLLIAASLEGRGRAEDVQAKIQAASADLLDGSASHDQILGALARLLDAAVETLPSSGHTADARSNLEAASAELRDRSRLSEKLHQHLALAYRALSGGKDFQFPDVHSIEEARAHIKNLAASSVAGLEKGQAGLTSRLLLECVIMVVTPVSR